MNRCNSNKYLSVGHPPPFNFHPFFCNWILFIWNGFYTWPESKLSFSSPFIIGSKFTATSIFSHFYGYLNYYILFLQRDLTKERIIFSTNISLFGVREEGLVKDFHIIHVYRHTCLCKHKSKRPHKQMLHLTWWYHLIRNSYVPNWFLDPTPLLLTFKPSNQVSNQTS